MEWQRLLAATKERCRAEDAKEDAKELIPVKEEQTSHAVEQAKELKEVDELRVVRGQSEKKAEAELAAARTDAGRRASVQRANEIKAAEKKETEELLLAKIEKEKRRVLEKRRLSDKNAAAAQAAKVLEQKLRKAADEEAADEEAAAEERAAQAAQQLADESEARRKKAVSDACAASTRARWDREQGVAEAKREQQRGEEAERERRRGQKRLHDEGANPYRAWTELMDVCNDPDRLSAENVDAEWRRYPQQFAAQAPQDCKSPGIYDHTYTTHTYVFPFSIFLLQK